MQSPSESVNPYDEARQQLLNGLSNWYERNLAVKAKELDSDTKTRLEEAINNIRSIIYNLNDDATRFFVDLLQT